MAKPPQPKQLLRQAAELFQGGQYDQAEPLCRTVLKADSTNDEAHHVLGAVALRTGRTDLAIAEVALAVRLKPGRAEYHNTLGAAHAGNGQHDRAIHHFWQALALEPNNIGAMSNLAKSLRAVGYADEAGRIAQQAAALDPNSISNMGLLCEAGKRFRDSGEIDRAIACFERAAELDPNSATPLQWLSTVVERKGQLDEAIRIGLKATELCPTDPEILKNQGSFYVQVGERDEALRWFTRAVESDPTYVAAHFALSESKRFEPGDPQIMQMEGLLADDSLSDADRGTLSFALGKACDDLGEYDQAFEYYRRGNLLKRQEVEYNPQSQVDNVSALIDVFTPDRFARLSDSMAIDSDVPIFIVGMPRSGTTLVEQILASHPDVFGAGELNHVRNMMFRLPSLAAGGEVFPYCLSSLAPGVAKVLAREYIEQLRQVAPDEKHVTDKMPWNHFMLGLIALLWPKARIVHCRRAPMAVGFSCYARCFATGQPFAWNLVEIGHYWRQYDRLCDHWRKVLPVRVLDVEYEHVVEHPEEEIRRLINHCGLSWHDRCLEFHRSRRRVKTSTDVRSPVYRDALERWRRYEHRLQPLKKAIAGELVP